MGNLFKIYSDHWNKMFRLYIEQYNLFGSMLMRPYHSPETRALRNYLDILSKRIGHFEGVYYRTYGG